MSPALRPVLTTADLPACELRSLVLDGEVFVVDDGVSPIDEVPGPRLRAIALGRTLAERLIVEQYSAAWVWGALFTPPLKHQVCADIAARSRPTPALRLDVREVVIDDSDLRRVGGIRVTSPRRTAIDLARFAPDGSTVRRVISRLMVIGDFTALDCIRVMDSRRNLPAKRRALPILREAAALSEQ